MPSKEEFSEGIKNRDEKDALKNTLEKKWGGLSGLQSALKTNLKQGIDPSTESKRQEEYGKNVMPVRTPPTLFELFFGALQDTTLIILMCAATVSIILGFTVEGEGSGVIEGTAILVAVLIVSLVTSINDYQKEGQFRKLNDKKEDRTVKVIRNGEPCTIRIFDVVVGDVIILESGEKIPADGIFIQGDELRVDESSMTGETDLKKKDEKDPWLLCGCQVNSGQATMLVIAVGPLTQWGTIKALAEKEGEDTPLQEKLTDLSELIGKLGFYSAALTFLALFVKWFFPLYNAGHTFGLTDLGELVDFLIVAITIIVVAVPEGLPLAVTIALAYSQSKMMHDNNLVRHLEACETMGGATNICSDKTGTLTTNVMTVTRLSMNGQNYDQNSLPKNPSGEHWTKLIQGCAVNSTAFIQKSGEEEILVGSKTECALLLMTRALGADYKAERKQVEIVKQWPFSSLKKRMSTLIKFKGNLILYAKGASEIVLKDSTHFLSEGQIVPMEKHRLVFSETIEEMAKNGLRTIGLAYRILDNTPDLEDEAPAEKLIFIGITGIKDPVRPNVPEAVEKCKRAGIKVRMLTGDNRLTATHIAQECGILTGDPETNVIEGPDFRKLTDDQLDKRLPFIEVMARSSPEDKYRLVKRLRHHGEVVAVTGDGTNDAPQLKEADVGFSMGITGTEVAKEASDIVLLDDNFASIVKALMWGRNVFDSIRKFVQFQLTVNIVAVTIAFAGALSLGESPLTPVQMLWVNLIMDTLAALALATETPTPALLDRKPYKRNESIVTIGMWKNILSQSLFQLVVLGALLSFPSAFPFFGLPTWDKWTAQDALIHSTVIFNTFVFCQLFNEINCRTLGSEINVFKNFFSNTIFIGVMLFTFVVQILIVNFGYDFASVRPLNTEQWIGCLLIGAFSLPYAVIIKLILPTPPEKTSPPTSPAPPRAEPSQDLSSSSENLNTPTKRRPIKTKD